MAIYKSKHTSNYTVIPNEVFKNGLSIESLGLLTYFLSLPADWKIYKTQLHAQLNIGRDKLDKLFKELADKGYIETITKRNNGRIGYDHAVYDDPAKNQSFRKEKQYSPYTEKPSTVKPYTEKPLTVKPLTVKPHLQSKHTQSKQLLSKDILSKHKESKHSIYQLAVDCWLKLHVNYIFNGMSGKHLKQLLDKIKTLLEKTNNDTSDESMISMFELIINNLPDWFKDKDLPVINSKFNEIIEQIKNSKNGKNKPSSKFNGFGI
jgi:DNA-binding Lrp family transcriptional regulator